MGKITGRYICSECGYESPKWLGKCPGCAAWNTLIEERIESKPLGKARKQIEAVPLNSIVNQDVYRFSSGIKELDRVLGGGIVPGSLVLLGGDPGIGKSTLLLQVSNALAATGCPVLYLSGEESLGQIRLRSARLGIDADNIYLLSEQNIDLLDEYVREIDPQLIIIDSIQTVWSQNITSIPGSVAQLRECTARIMDMAKKKEKAVFLVGHVTKEGVIAGPKVLEHMVDVVVYFEGEKNYSYRILRGAKNRFGATDEIGLLEMSARGLTEVTDPSYIFLGQGEEDVCGSAVTASFEGSRPILIEIQALVAATNPGYSRRMASGIDQNRLALIIAVLEKCKGFQLSAYDVYLKVTGGLFLKDPSADLGIAAAIISSYQETPLPVDAVFSGEVSLSGQVRAVPFMEQRIKEVEKMGYKKMLIPGGSREKYRTTSLEVIEIKDINQLVEILMKG